MAMKFFVKNSSWKSQKIRWPQNSDEMFQEFWSEFWQPTSLSNHSITGFNRIVSNKFKVNAKTRILIRIPISKELCSHLFLKIGKVDTKSDDSGNLMEFFNDFDENTDGKF